MVTERHPDGPAAGAALAVELAAGLAESIERLREFPRLGHAGLVPDVLELVVRAPTRSLTCVVGYRVQGDRVTLLGITWGGRRFDGGGLG